MCHKVSYMLNIYSHLIQENMYITRLYTPCRSCTHRVDRAHTVHTVHNTPIPYRIIGLSAELIKVCEPKALNSKWKQCDPSANELDSSFTSQCSVIFDDSSKSEIVYANGLESNGHYSYRHAGVHYDWDWMMCICMFRRVNKICCK